MSIRFKLAILLFGLFGLIGAVPAMAQNATEIPPEATWPTTLTYHGATATIYEPQPTSWPNRTIVYATAAMTIHRPGARPIVGTVDIAATTQTDFSGRWVTFSKIRVLATHFPMLSTNQAARLQARITAIAAKLGGRRVPLDTLLLALNETPAETKPVATNDMPPMIFHSTSPAILLVTDGPPVLAPLSGTGLSFAVNTNWTLLQEKANGQWFLLAGTSWLSAPDFTGPYQPAGVLPTDFSKLPNDPSFADVKKYVPNGPAPNPVPFVFVSTEPAQIIVTNGPAQLSPVAGAPLQYVSNSSAEVIFDPSTKTYYVLFSGRWFSAPSLEGPWVYATPSLPPTFALIPPDGPQGDVLASVPGTAQAQEAVISAQIPRQATLPRTSTIHVVYSGAPNFVPIAGTDLTYAVNTYAQVVAVNGTYYACNNGAWYVASTPTGPWVLATRVPQAIYTIPPTSPLYPVTYVRIYSVSPTVVVTGYTAGYTMGLIAAAGVVVYGTGYYYPPLVIAGAVPFYVPYPYTYGGGIRYVSSTGAWVSGGAVYGPYGGVAARSAYNPATGAYAHGAAVWGPNGGSAYGSFSNPATGRYGSTSQSWDPYGRSGSSTVTGPNQTVHTQSRGNANGAAGSFTSSSGAHGGGVYNKSNGNTTTAGKAANGDIYAGHNGNVYQHSDSGWSKYDSSTGGFKPVTPPETVNRNGTSPGAQNDQRSNAMDSASMTQSFNRQSGGDDFGQLNHDFNARQGGWQRQDLGGRSFGGGGFGGGRRR